MMQKISTFTIFYFFLQVGFFCSFTTSDDYYCDCNPEHRCKSSKVGSKVADTQDTNSYYLCLEDSEGNIFPSDHSIKCPVGYYFEIYSNDCESGTGHTQYVNICNSGCTHNNYENVPDLEDCSSYYSCLPNGTKEQFRCPESTPYFDGKECRKDEYVCCNCCDECTPVCSEINKEVIDPYDCRSYYLCQSIGIPTEESRYQCTAGKYFNPSLGTCEIENDTDLCTPRCSNTTASL